MIEFLHNEQNGKVIKVRLNGVIVGEIRTVFGGFQYVPKGQRQGGRVFKTLVDCQHSLA